MDSFIVLVTNQILHLLQLLLQLFDSSITDSRCDATFQDLVSGVLYVLQVAFELTHHVVPQLETGVTLHAFGKNTGEAAGTFVTAFSCCALLALACSAGPVTLCYF